jgi:monomeric sarcosine oxidase
MMRYDAIVVGGGTMGSAAAWDLAKRGLRTLVFEQFAPIHALGSYAGKTRIIREVYAESPDYVPLVHRSETLWAELEREVERQLFFRTGGIDLSAPGYVQAYDARRAAIEHGLEHEWLDGSEVRHRWPAWHLGDEWVGCYSPRTGFLLAEESVASLTLAATRRGAEVRANEPVRWWQASDSGVEVRTDLATYGAERLVIAAGAWARQVLSQLALPLLVLRKVVWWFDVDDPAPFEPGRFPIFLTEGDTGAIYGFPVRGNEGIKIGNHSGGLPTSPNDVDRTAHPEEIAEVRPFVRQFLPGVSGRVVDRAVCLYTLSPDRDFIVDRHPEHANVVLAAGFSGHGFKFAPVIGELLGTLALDSAVPPIPRFAVGRFSQPRQ